MHSRWQSAAHQETHATGQGYAESRPQDMLTAKDIKFEALALLCCTLTLHIITVGIVNSAAEVKMMMLLLLLLLLLLSFEDLFCVRMHHFNWPKRSAVCSALIFTCPRTLITAAAAAAAVINPTAAHHCAFIGYRWHDEIDGVN
jgi:hypothetical protein